MTEMRWKGRRILFNPLPAPDGNLHWEHDGVYFRRCVVDNRHAIEANYKSVKLKAFDDAASDPLLEIDDKIDRTNDLVVRMARKAKDEQNRRDQEAMGFGYVGERL